MIELVRRGAALGLLFCGVTACASTPAYPIMANSAPAASPPVATPPPAPAPADLAPAPPPPATESTPQAVESQPLAPVQAPMSPSADQPAAPPPAPARRVVTRTPPAEPVRYIATGKVVDAHKMYRSYKVRRGDHLDAIARDLETTPATLIEANHLNKPNALRPGQRLKVPVEKVYVVQSGDTVVAVAKRFDVSAADLADLNVISETHRLKAGDQLALPGGYHDTGPVVAPPTRMAGAFYPSGGYRSTTWPVRPSAPVSPGAYPSPLTPGGPALTDSQVAEAGRGRFVWPVVGDMLQTFGEKDVGRRNDGIDVKAPQGAPVKAAAGGEVVYAGDQVPGFGNLVLVKHADGWVTAYAHLEKVGVKMRETVAQGQQIGEVGQSGGVSEPQLHFEVRYAPTPMDKARPVDPLLVLPK